MPIAGRRHCGRNVFEIEDARPRSKRGHLLANYAPEAFRVAQADGDAVYRWNSKRIARHFCSACGCDPYLDSPAFQPAGAGDGVTRRIGVNARLLDGFEAADWPVTVIDGKRLWGAIA